MVFGKRDSKHLAVLYQWRVRFERPRLRLDPYPPPPAEVFGTEFFVNVEKETQLFGIVQRGMYPGE